MATQQQSKKVTNIKSLKAIINELPDNMPVRSCWGVRVEGAFWKRDDGESGWPVKFFSLDER